MYSSLHLHQCNIFSEVSSEPTKDTQVIRVRGGQQPHEFLNSNYLLPFVQISSFPSFVAISALNNVDLTRVPIFRKSTVDTIVDYLNPNHMK